MGTPLRHLSVPSASGITSEGPLHDLGTEAGHRAPQGRTPDRSARSAVLASIDAKVPRRPEFPWMPVAYTTPPQIWA